MVKWIIKRLFSVFGYRLAKMRPKPEERPQHRGAIRDQPFYIEFIGPSGVGKSTLYNAFKQHRTDKDTWIGIDEFLGTLPDRKLTKEVPAIYKRIIKRKWEFEAKRDPSFRDLDFYMNYFFRNLKEDILQFSHNTQSMVVSDEGLFHNFGDCLMALQAETEAEAQVRAITRNRAIVLCHGAPETIARQIRDRESRTGVINPRHVGLSDEELMEMHRSLEDTYAERSSFITSLGIPILELHTADLPDDNMERFRTFLRTHFRGMDESGRP